MAIQQGLEKLETLKKGLDAETIWIRGNYATMTEQQKYLDALRKAEDLKKAFEELSPASQAQLAKDVLQVTSLQEAIKRIKMIFQSNGWM